MDTDARRLKPQAAFLCYAGFCLIVLLFACSQDPYNQVHFSRDLVPILENRCLRCHVAGRTAPDMTSGSLYGILVDKGYVNPFNPHKSRAYLMEKKQHAIMHSMTPVELELFRRWIEQGAKNN